MQLSSTKGIEMRKEFVEAKRASEARRKAPWAAVVAKVVGGYIAFESVVEYETWRRQR